MSVRGFVFSLFAAVLLLVAPASASAAGDLLVPSGLQHFGNTYLGDSSTKTFTLKSVGSSPVTITSASVYPLANNSEYFSIVEDSCSGGTFAQDETCDLKVEFSATAIGFRYTSIQVQHSGPDGSEFFGIDGTGIDPGIDVDPTSHDFGDIEVWEYGTAKTFTITNDGTTDLDTGPTISGSDAGQFYFTTQPSCGSIPPEGTCAVTVNVRPLGEAGARSANLVIANNTKSENPVTIPLTATALKAHMTANVESVPFGDLDLYTNPSLTRQITITSDGTAPLDPVAATYGAFTVNHPECETDGSIAPGDTCTYTATFTGDEVSRPYFSNLQISSNGNQLTIPLTAKIVKGEISSYSTTQVDVGDVEIGQTGYGSILLNSSGNAPLRFGSPQPVVSGPDADMFDVIQPSDCSNLPSGGHCQLEVHFNPTSLAGKVAYVNFSGNFGEYSVTLEGSGIQALANLPADENFGQVKVGDTKTLTMSVISNGDAPLNLDAPEIQGPDASSFSASFEDGGCTNKARGEECQVQLTYKPTTVGTHEATLHLTGNIVQSIPLSGSARALTPAKVTLKLSAPQKKWRGQPVTLTAKISKSGEQQTGPLILNTAVPKRLAGAVKPIRIPSLGTGNQTVTKIIKVKVKKAARKAGKLNVKVSVTGKGIKPAPATVIWRMRKRPEIL